MDIQLRKLAPKSIIGFGSFRDLSVQNVLDTQGKMPLISMYYNLERVSFLDEVLELLGITGEFVIQKPGKDKDKFESFKQTYFASLKKASDPSIDKQTLMIIKNNHMRRKVKTIAFNKKSNKLFSPDAMRERNHGGVTNLKGI